MNKKLLINFLQNLTLLTLTFTAVLLLTRFPMIEEVVGGQVRGFLVAPENREQEKVDLSEVIAFAHLVVTNETEFSRYSRLNLSTAGPEFQAVEPLLRGAIGSAATRRAATHAEFRAALETPGIYVDLATALPLSVVAAWLGESFDGEDNIRALALTTARETVLLFLLLEDGSLVRCECALTSSAVREVTMTFAPNGGQFAFESEYGSLAPYTVLVQAVDAAAVVNASIPAGYSAYNLLSALEFNAHTNSRYFESSGTEVIMQSPHLLRVGTDGSVHYSSDGEVTESLYRIPCKTESPDAVEVLNSAYRLALVLSEGTNASGLFVEKMARTQTGWIVEFCYRPEGIKMQLGNDRAALRLMVTGNTITEFDYYCRAYTPVQEFSELLPPTMAAAIASMHEGAELTLAYAEGSAGVYNAQWFAQ